MVIVDKFAPKIHILITMWKVMSGFWSIMLSYTMTFVAQIQFRPDISTAVPDSRKLEVFKSQEFHDNHEYITLDC